mmetsp:Transcript_927/g.2921  ORF Transcript_927/g.2921 Transcript_927/m.2921 type:complete len:396 (+) Transcript_927:313-1500(+)|eukprot:CAMPEP_0198726874 /NCGR_PEP_ID=MMETSP1475-20131203/3788_1 /TAXON_ID= ORGANISM="Unidentified sp., Strain CCMP1999" /NCGR_SAMPLE_ID=MMETSP1475 /ASSEMBLY_ACC=CAM_ASM_001111 /LENGTH=395 /DNA_ID=CAMNT_0044488847 /DNA_START=250 /DNA_END=1437 /DNA_ORIENTATION=+
MTMIARRMSVDLDTMDGISAEMYKEGQRLHMRSRRRFLLQGNRLSCSMTNRSRICWEINVSKCEIYKVSRKKILVSFPFRDLILHADTEDQRDEWHDALFKAASSDITLFYTMGSVIGRGCFGEVRRCLNNKTRELTAIKVIKKRNCTPEDLHYLEREVSIVRDLYHENIVRTVDVFETMDTLCLCMEYMGGGMLYDNISEAGYFTEKIASQIFAEILHGVQYLHDHGIAHRDIKPENILCSRKEWPYHVKLSDFGLSNYSGAPMRTRVGTPYFVAPEVLKGHTYGTAVDSWSCGVVLYNLLSGKLPFDSEEEPEKIFRLILDGKFTFPDREWENISRDAKRLIKDLLVVDPEKRLTIKGALKSRWLSSSSLSESNILNDRSTLHSSKRNIPRLR